MPRKPANPKNDTTAKKPTRRKKTIEPVAEAPVVETAAETVVDTPAPKKRGRKPKAAADAVVADAPVKKTRGRKVKAEAPAETVADTVAADAPAPKKRGRKAKAETNADAPVKKTRGRKKAAPEIIAEPAPPVDAEAVVVEETVDIQPDMVVDVPSDEPLPGQLSFDGEVTASVAEEAPTAPVEESAPVAEAPAKKPRKPRAKKAEKKADAAPKKRGRRPKEPGMVMTTTLQIGETEFDISALAEKAYKEYKRVHKRKIITDFHVYVKPEEGAAYYTVNGEGAEEFKIDLT